MCVLSMVMDDFGRRPLPWDPGTNRPWYSPPPMPTLTPKQIKALQQLAEQFREATEAAKTVDRLTGQPDCEDPEKAKLEKRVEELERRLAELEKPKRKPRRRV